MQAGQMMSTYSPSAFWWPTSEARRAEKRKGAGRIECDECGQEFAPWRIRRVAASASLVSAGNTTVHHFCEACHRQVFAEASHEKYPSLFVERMELKPGMTHWKTGHEMAELFGMTRKGFSGRLRHTDTLMGLRLEMRRIGRVKYYRVIEEA